MTAVVEQLGDLTQYVEGNPGWSLVEADDVPFATRQIRITEEVCWTFQLRPQGDGMWRAFAAHQTQHTHVGSLLACQDWLARKLEAAVKQQHQVEWLAEWARTERGWRLVEADRGWKPFAVRTFDFPEARTAERVGLLLAWNARRVPAFTASVQVEHADGPEAACSDGRMEVAGWLVEWTQTLVLPRLMRDCPTWTDAYKLADRAPVSRVMLLAALFGLRTGSPAAARADLVRLFSQH